MPACVQAMGQFVTVTGLEDWCASSDDHESPLGPPRSTMSEALRDAEIAAAFLNAQPRDEYAETSMAYSTPLTGVFTRNVFIRDGKIIFPSEKKAA